MSVTLVNLGTTSLVGTASSSTVATKGLVAGTNMTFTTSSTDVTIAYNTPICRVTNSSPPAITTSTTPTLLWDTNLEDPTGMHSTSMNTDRINILTTGVYTVSCCIQYSPASAPTGNVFISLMRVSGGTTTIGAVGHAITQNAPYIWNASCTLKLTAGDYVYVVFQNGTTVTLTPTRASNYTPVFTVNYVGNY